MAITKMNKFTLICFNENKKSVLKNLQTFGNSQFINLQTEVNEEDNPLNFMEADVVDEDIRDIDNKLASLRGAIGLLNRYVPKVSGLKAMREGKSEVSYLELQKDVESCDWEEICTELKSKELRLNEINNKINKINGEIELLKPWKSLDVSFNDLANMNDIKTHTGIIRISNEENITSLELSFNELDLSNLYIVNRMNNELYVVIFAHSSQLKEVEELLRTFDYTDVKISCTEETEKEIKKLTNRLSALKHEDLSMVESLRMDNRLSLLEKCEEYFANAKERLECSKNFVRSKNTVVLSGWVPFELNAELEEAVKTATKDVFVLSFEDVTEHEDLEVPVKLKNNKFISAFESITEMYSLPNYKGMDPTPWLAPFYLIFFGMMVADIGYGVLVTIAALLSLKLLNLEDGSKNFAKLFGYLGLSTTVWGLIYGAGFGDAISFKSLLNQNDDIFTIMYMSIAFGVVQILIGLLLKGYMLIKAKNYFGAFSEVGLWLLTFAGITIMALGYSIGTWIMIVGMVGIVLTNGGDAKSIGGKLGNGAYALYGITGYVGDLISYTRLMALGIAGGSIAGAMNLIIGYIPGVAAIVICPIMFVLLHIFNLLLGLLGAYVHSCRLQYVEYFGKFYDGGGQSFKPLKMRNKKINVK